MEAMAASVLLSLPLWGLLTRLAWALDATGVLPWLAVAASIAATLAAPRRPLRLAPGPVDAAALGLGLVHAALLVAVFSANGFQADGSYLARSWWARDGFYLFAQAQAAIGAAGAVHGNPFVAGAPDLYPSFFHDALAGISMIAGGPAAIAVPVIAPAYLSAAVVMIVPAMGARLDRRASWREAALAAGWALAFLALRPDLFAYPSAQPLAFGALLLTFRLLVARKPGPHQVALAICILAALVLGHTVTSAAALAVAAVAALACLAGRGGRATGVVLACAVAALAAAWLAANAVPNPRLSGGSSDPLRDFALEAFIGPWIVPASAVIVLAATRYRDPAAAATPVVLLGLCAVSYFNGRGLPTLQDALFVLFNAERFAWLALLASGPLLLTRPGWIPALAVAATLAGAVALPHPLALRTAGLVTDEGVRMTAAAIDAYAVVADATPVDARFVTTAHDFAMPAFTGRSQAPVEPGMHWSYGAFEPGKEDSLYLEHRGMFDMAPDGRAHVKARRGYTHAWVDFETGADPQRVAATFLPDGRASVLVAGPGFAVLDLGP
jgi:hypothetical protein